MPAPRRESDPSADQVEQFLERQLDGFKLEPFQRAFLEQWYPSRPRVDVVHVITELGPTDGPGLIVDARLAPRLGAYMGDTWVEFGEPIHPDRTDDFQGFKINLDGLDD